MEEAAAMNGWLSDQDTAIRQFCPARTEQQRSGWEELFADQDQMEMWPGCEMTHLDPSEAELIVHTFFDVECYEKDNAGKSDEEEIRQSLPLTDEIYFQSNGYSTMMEGGGVDDQLSNNEVDQGLELVHLLLACAEAVGCQDARLAESILARVWRCVNPWGDSLQRVSHCFAEGLNSRLSLLQNLNPNGSFSNRATALHLPLICRDEKSEAFALLHHTTPYIAFGFAAANDAICEAAKEREVLHIVDLGMEHNLQWPSLVRSLSCRPKGPPKVIRITGVIGDVKDPTSKLESSMNDLKEVAKCLGIFLEFQLVREEVSPLSLTEEKLELRMGDALFVNSIMHLHKHVRESRRSLKTILQSIKKLNPVLLTVVEQDANHNGPFFLGRFLESLHYYSAIFDSLDASLPRRSLQRMKIEKLHLAEEIRNVVAYEGSDRTERHERADQWRRQLGRAGFQVVGVKCMKEAEMVVSGYGCDGYTVASEKGCLQLGWKGKPIMLASAWHHPPS